MRRIRPALLALAAFGLVALSARAAEATTFPTLTGKDLTKASFTVPSSLEKPLNLIVVAFKQEQQSLVDTWIPAMVALEESRADFAFYEFPTMPKMNPALRWFIASGMRRGIQDEAARKRTVSFHIALEPFREVLAIPHDDDIYTFLVDLDGTILWRTTGIYDSANVKAFQAALAAQTQPAREAPTGASGTE